jgi:hypothetical protein
MPRSKDSNTRVYKVRNDAVYMAIGFIIARITTSLRFGESDIREYKESAINEFDLTDIETAIAGENISNYLLDLEGED